MRKFLMLAAIGLALTGCATVSDSGTASSPSTPPTQQSAKPDAAPQTAAAPTQASAGGSLFAAKPDVAVVYVYRDQTVGMAIGMDVLLDGQSIGKTKAKRYIRAEIAPGSHLLSCTTEAKSELPLELEAGKVYYVWQQVKMGLVVARNKLQIVDEAKGQKGVKACKPVDAS